jgi:adenylylsulfate kinase
MNPKTLFPGTIWITGPSMSGKTTLGRHLQDTLESRGIYNVELLDGPDVRKNLEGAHGYSAKERSVVVLEIARLALECNNRGKVAIVCTISHVKEVRMAVRGRLGRFFEVYLKCPLDVCLRRDYLGNYQKAYAGDYENFVDVTEPYQVSEHPDLLLDTANNSVEECTDILLANTQTQSFRNHPRTLSDNSPDSLSLDRHPTGTLDTLQRNGQVCLEPPFGLLSHGILYILWQLFRDCYTQGLI